MDFQTVLPQTQAELEHHLSALPPLPYLALDLETAYWWKAQQEQIALLQLAYRVSTGQLEVLLLDVQALPSLQPLQAPLEDPNVTVAIHNASFDAIKLYRFCGIQTRPIHDTMRAARRAGARKYSLAAQVQEHFGVSLDKAEQQSDWSRRPFTASQLTYAAKDAVYTLLLYERQREQGLSGAYELRSQDELPLLTEPPQLTEEVPAIAVATLSPLPPGMDLIGLAALGVIVKKPNYYSPTGLVVALGKERSGLAGWIVSTLLGEQAEIEEREAQHAITRLMAQGWLGLDEYGRCDASPAGIDFWRITKPAQLP